MWEAVQALTIEVRSLRAGQTKTTKAVQNAELRLLSKVKAGKRLGVGHQTLNYLVKTKQVITVKVGKRMKVTAASVEQLALNGFTRP